MMPGGGQGRRECRRRQACCPAARRAASRAGGGCRCGNRGSGPRRPDPIAGDRAGPGGWDERDRGLPCRGPGRAGAGQAGRAVTTEARARGYAVTAVVRDPAGYPHLGAEGVTVVRGDVTDPRSVAGTAAGHTGAVHAVSPFIGPEQGLDTLDHGFFVKAADALLDGLAVAGVGRLIAVGPGANLLGANGRPVMDAPGVFPTETRPFALAHTAGLHRLRERGDGPVDRVMPTPAGRLEHGGARTGRYRIAGSGCPATVLSHGCRTRISRWRWSTRSNARCGAVSGCRCSTSAPRRGSWGGGTKREENVRGSTGGGTEQGTGGRETA
ncbi:NAD(P)-dependent oxidoreductase [Streptomyces olivaceoviridis]|uniref:NAD(P)-dependent oxidoreductase n=1 Tax=Streptomyces olivaceoviridis TaxID=1921 RepID=UPI0037A34C7C